MARYWPPEKTPIEKVLDFSRKLRIIAEKIEASSQAIAKTDFKEPWIFYFPNAELALEKLQGYNAALYAQQTKMEMGDPGAPSSGPEIELSESTKETLDLAKKALKSKKPLKKKKAP